MTTLLDKWKLLLELTRDPELTRLDIAVAAAMLDSAGEDGRMFRAKSTLAEQTGCCARTIANVRNRLVDREWFRRAAYASGGKGKATVYMIVDRAKGATACTLSGTDTVQPVAPFEAQRVQSDDPKGATACTPTLLDKPKGIGDARASARDPSPRAADAAGGSDASTHAIDTSTSTEVLSPFEQFLAECPKAAPDFLGLTRKIWDQALRSGVAPSTIIYAMREHREGTPGRFHEQPHRFLQRQGWLDPVKHQAGGHGYASGDQTARVMAWLHGTGGRA